MYDIYVCCGVGSRLESSSAEIGCSNESSGHHTASECTSHARRVTGLADTAGARQWVSSELVPTENPGRFHYLQQGDLQENFPRFNMCISPVLLYQYRHYCRQPPWEKRKIRDHDTRPEPYPNPNWNVRISIIWVTSFLRCCGLRRL